MPRTAPFGYLNGFSAYDWNRPLARPGVYKITCLVNGKCYVGATSNMKARFGNGYRMTNALKSDVRLHGKHKFLVEALYYSIDDSVVNLELIESFLILAHNAVMPFGYNTTHALFSRRPDVAVAISEVSKALWGDLLYRHSVMATRATIQPLINEALEDAWRRGHDERVSAMRDPDYLNKLSIGQHRRHLDPNEGAKLSRSQKRRWKDTGKRLEQSAKQTAFASTDEGKRVKSEATKGRIWITDGKINKRVLLDETAIPDGWWSGRTNNGNLGRKSVQQDSAATVAVEVQGELWSGGVKGSHWITDGVANKRNPKGEPVPDGWRRGRSRAPSQKDDVSR